MDCAWAVNLVPVDLELADVTTGMSPSAIWQPVWNGTLAADPRLTALPATNQSRFFPGRPRVSVANELICGRTFSRIGVLEAP
jgi:hypothetical protein